MLFLESPSFNPYFNLALEQYVFDCMDRNREYFMLWQNDNAVIIGKNQNTIAEINQTFIKEHEISVVRRLSGGGAVYHDLGNINFTFITDAGKKEGFDFSAFCVPIVKALASFGVRAEMRGRNDIVIDGKKFSGNAQYIKQGRIMHHGTIMFDTNLDVMRQALAAPKDKITSAGTKSVQSMVTNIKDHISADTKAAEFLDALRGYMFKEYDLRGYELSPEDMRRVVDLQNSVYDTWEWNYGHSPAYSIVKERRVEGFGELQIHMDAQGGVIREVAFYGDFFGSGDIRELAILVKGKKAEEGELRKALFGADIGKYFFRMDLDTFISIILQ